MGFHGECGRGWSVRCANAKGRNCRCKCGGANHGKLVGGLNRETASMKLTDHEVFDREFDLETMEFKSYREFLPLGLMIEKFFRLERDHNGAALVNIPQQYVYHSPTGFEWGYGGSGPADLALNILGVFLPAPEAWRLHQSFKWDIIARIAKEGGNIPAETVRSWIRWKWAEEDQKASQLQMIL